MGGLKWSSFNRIWILCTLCKRCLMIVACVPFDYTIYFLCFDARLIFVKNSLQIKRRLRDLRGARTDHNEISTRTECSGGRNIFWPRENDLGWVCWAMSSKPKPSLTRYTDFSARQTDQRQCQLWMIVNFSLFRLHACISFYSPAWFRRFLSLSVFDILIQGQQIEELYNIPFFSSSHHQKFGFAVVGYSLYSFRFWPFLWHKTFWVLASWIAWAFSCSINGIILADEDKNVAPVYFLGEQKKNHCTISAPDRPNQFVDSFRVFPSSAC